MKRRQFLISSAMCAAMLSFLPRYAWADNANPEKLEKITMSDEEWQKKLTPAQYEVLREEGTERAFTNPMYLEKRKGRYLCAGCGLELFQSDMKYDSGTGWPSFFDVVPERIETKKDRGLLHVRTEYHCARCGGHQGHVFEDGPAPTGLRYCNNGVSLTFIPEEGEE